MKLIKPSYKIYDQPTDVDSILETIEIAGRTCYKSEDKITPLSAKQFYDKMVGYNHGAMLEHGTVYLIVPNNDDKTMSKLFGLNNIWTRNNAIIENDNEIKYYVTTNMRVLKENNILDVLKYQSPYTDKHHKRITVKFILDRGISHEFVRHRVFSFAQESTRYCNYSKDKFNNEITFIEPLWLSESDGYDEYIKSLEDSEKAYFALLNKGWKPQQARNVLPTSLKTELVMTGFRDDWDHFFKLRAANSAHPQAKELATMLMENIDK